MGVRTVESEIAERLARLREEDRRRVLAFTRSLAGSGVSGEPGKNLLRFAGLIPPEDLREMQAHINLDCGPRRPESPTSQICSNLGTPIY
jgi:hypothetical protein